MRTDDPRDYLMTEARIIAENKTHAVIALRVDKSMIARNLLFIAALADLITAPEHGPTLNNSGCV